MHCPPTGKTNYMETRSVIILANGRFPESAIALGYLDSADKLICCDGSVAGLLDYGLEPDAIVGDLDSVPTDLRQKFSDRLHHSDDQDTNDLTKAVRYCIASGYNNLTILGATGLREDHTLGNISLLADYAESVSVKMLTDHGVFIPVNSGDQINSWSGQQVSVFAIDRGMKISSENLRFPLDQLELSNLWMGTLNECTSDWFRLDFPAGRVLVFLCFE